MIKENNSIEKLYDHFPNYVRDYLKEATRSIGSDPSYALTVFIAVASACIGTSVKVFLSRTWAEYVGIFGVLIGAPSAKKSPMISAISSPLEEIGARYDEEFIKDNQAYEAAKREKVEGLVPPIERTAYTTNMTLEAMAKLYHENPIGIIILKDELAHTFKHNNAYKNGSGDLQEILEAYNNKPVSVSRKTSSSIRVRKTFLSIIGGMQPAVFAEIFSQESVGLKERFIFGFDNKMIRKREISEEDVQKKTHDNYLNGLIAVRLSCEEIVRKKKCREYRFSNEAREYWKEWVATLPVGTDIDAMYGKMEGRVPRFAAILHTLENHMNTDNIISLKTVKAAVDFANFYIESHKQAIRLFDEGDLKDKINKAVSWLRSCYRDKKYLDVVDGRTGPKITTFTNNEVAGVKNTLETKKILGLLSDRGYGYFQKSRSNQYPKEIFCLFPRYQ